MQATLIYNGNSGGAKSTSADALQELLEEVGFAPVYKETQSEADLDEVLAETQGLVVAAGGDGTVHAVAKRLIGNDKAALAPLPIGTANNIGKSLGVKGSLKEVIRGLKNPKKCLLDIGSVQAPWCHDYFFEAAGCGLFADILADYDPEKGKSPLRAAGTIKDVLVGYDAKAQRFSLDAQDLSGTYVAVEVMNMKATGPRLKLAPEADPTDGLFDVACVLKPESVGLLDYLGGLFTDSFHELDNVEVLRGKKLELNWDGSPIHLDDALRPEGVTDSEKPSNSAGGGTVTIEVLPGALELWLPGESS